MGLDVVAVNPERLEAWMITCIRFAKEPDAIVTFVALRYMADNPSLIAPGVQAD